MDGDAVGEAGAETVLDPSQVFQTMCSRGVVPVDGDGDAADGDAGAVVIAERLVPSVPLSTCGRQWPSRPQGALTRRPSTITWSRSRPMTTSSAGRHNFSRATESCRRLLNFNRYGGRQTWREQEKRTPHRLTTNRVKWPRWT